MIKRNDKSYNKSQIAKYINMKGETSKPEIASELGISMPTVLQNVKELIQSGIVAEAGKYESTGWRKASVLSISANLKNAVGIDITANHISYVLINLCGTVIAKKRIKSAFENSLSYYENIACGLDVFLNETDAEKDKILGAGISFPGIIDKNNEMLIRSHIRFPSQRG